MSQQLIELQKRIGNAIFQVRCDRRTLATIAQHFSETHSPASISQTIRLALEFCERAILAEHPDYELLSVEDADHYLSAKFEKYTPNPSGRNLSIYKQQLERESAFLEGRDIGATHSRVTKAMIESSKGSITPQLVKKTFDELTKKGILKEESIEEAQRRREEELEEMKSNLSKPKV